MKTLDIAIKEPFQIYCCIQIQMTRLKTINQTIATSDPNDTRQIGNLTEWQQETRDDLKRLLKAYCSEGYKILNDRAKLIALGIDI